MLEQFQYINNIEGKISVRFWIVYIVKDPFWLNMLINNPRTLTIFIADNIFFKITNTTKNKICQVRNIVEKQMTRPNLDRFGLNIKDGNKMLVMLGVKEINIDNIFLYLVPENSVSEQQLKQPQKQKRFRDGLLKYAEGQD